MAPLYGTLAPLVTEVTTASGAKSDTINIFRLTFGNAAQVLEAQDSAQRINLMASTACRAVVGDNEETFTASELDAADAAEIVGALVDMLRTVPLTVEGDGVNHPMVYTLKYPIRTGRGDSEVVTAFEFSARTLGQIAGFLDAEGDAATFREFMRSFSSIIGVQMPVTDVLVNALDVFDYSMIKEHIMGKLATSRGRLKKAS